MLPSRVLTVAGRERSYASYLPPRLCHVHPFSFPCARGHWHVAIGRAFGNRNVADINPTRTDPRGGWAVAMERPPQAGAPAAGRHRRGASELLFLFSNPYGTPDQCGRINVR